MQTADIATDLIQVGKEFYVNERDRFYENWLESFWREMFQNSCDAGAKNIDITLSSIQRRGAFFRSIDSSEKIIRVVFEDNGCGMSPDVIENVFFKPGKTTKGDGSTT